MRRAARNLFIVLGPMLVGCAETRIVDPLPDPSLETSASLRVSRIPDVSAFPRMRYGEEGFLALYEKDGSVRLKRTISPEEFRNAARGRRFDFPGNSLLRVPGGQGKRDAAAIPSVPIANAFSRPGGSNDGAMRHSRYGQTTELWEAVYENGGKLYETYGSVSGTRLGPFIPRALRGRYAEHETLAGQHHSVLTSHGRTRGLRCADARAGYCSPSGRGG